MTLPDEGDIEVGFQEYFVRRQHDVAVSAVRFDGADAARPAPGVLEAIAAADTIVVAPSNPIVSIGPVLAVPGVRQAVERDAIERWRCRPSSPAPRSKVRPTACMQELGHDASVVGVARLYEPFTSTLVIDEADRASAPAVDAAGVRSVVTQTIMRTPADAAELARVTLGALS